MISLGTSGRIEQIFVCGYSGDPMRSVTEVEAIAGSGLKGDRYSLQTGYWSGVDECHVTLIEGELLDRVSEDLQIPMLSGEHRRNLVTRGLRLTHLLGREFAVGETILAYDCPRPPCRHLQAVSGLAVVRALFGQRAGIGASILRSGMIRVGDPVFVVQGELPARYPGRSRPLGSHQ